jgi:hypothetical protein
MSESTQKPDDKKPKIDRGSKIYQEMIMAGLLAMDTAVSEINEESAKRQRSVPEPYFANVLLPILRKWIKNDPKDPAEPGLWFNCAGGLNNPLNVADPKGQLLFTVPPLFMDIPTRNRKGQEGMVSIHQLVDMQGHMFDNGDQRKAFEVEDELVEILEPKPEHVERTRHLVSLVHVYRRYNLPLSELLGELATEVEAELNRRDAKALPAAEQKKPDAGIDDDEEYEL